MDMVDMSYEPPDFYEFEVSPYPVNSPPNVSKTPAPIALVSFLTVPQGGDPAVDHLKTALVAAAVLSLFFLIAKDAHKAFTRRAHWIPCDFLVLSAFSIQMLNMLNTQNQALESSPNNQNQAGHWMVKDQVTIAPQYAGWKDILMIHNSRTILCVFTAYVMPAMADRGMEHAWVRWVALVITVFHHVTSQYYSAKDKGRANGSPIVNGTLPVKAAFSLIDNHRTVSTNFRRLWPQPNSDGSPEAPYYVCATIISLCFILLILLLANATIAGRSIECIVSKKISSVLRGEGEFSAALFEKGQQTHPQHPRHHHSCLQNVKSDVNEADEHIYHLHHVHDHSCWRTVEDGVGEEEQHRRHCRYCWRRVEDEVLKAWIIVRAYSVQPVLARSALTAASAVIVTVQIAITLVGGFTNVFKKEKGQEQDTTFKLVATIVQSVFILMAWALINLRWATGVAYHRRPQKDKWRSGLKMEDFWTRYLKELEHAGEFQLEEAQSLDREIERLVSKKQITPTVPRILSAAVIGMQWLIVSFSKACLFVSLMIFHNELMLKLFRFMFEEHILFVFEDYKKYEKILEEVQMLGETPESLWVSNRKSIEQAKMLSIQGNQEGENCDHLVEYLIDKRTAQGVGLNCLEPYKPQTGLNFLCKKKRILQPQEKERDVEKQQSVGGENSHVTDMNTKSWKMTAVSLLTIIFHLYPFYAELDKKKCSTSQDSHPNTVKDCFKTYSQAWEIVDFVEAAATEADKITSEAADKQFKLLQKKVDEEDFPASDPIHATPARVRRELDSLKEKCKGRPNRWQGKDSMDWKASALDSAVYNLCASIECNDESNVTGLLKELESSLADVINECLAKTQNLLLLNSRKWALRRDEKQMGKALYTTGKAKAIMEKLACNKLAIVSYH